MKLARLAPLAAAVAALPLSAQQVTPYGCGVNPAGSLTVLSGTPSLNTTLTLGIDNPAGTQGCSTFTALLLDAVADPAYPCGTQLPGWGMSAAGAPGELLVTLQDGYTLLGGPTWGCTPGPAPVSFPIPPLIDLVDQHVYVQGVTYSPTGTVQFGLTEGLDLLIGPTPASLALGTSVGSALNPASEFEIYRITARAGDELVLPYSRLTGGGFNLQFDLYDPSGSLVVSHTGTSGFLRPGPLPTTGDYLLAVSTGSGVSGSYHLGLQRTTDPGGATPVAIGDSFGDSIGGTRCEIDVFEISARAGDQLVIPWSRLTGGGFTLRADLYDARGTVVDTLSAGSAEFTPATIPADGTYYLWMYNPNLDTTGSYHLTIERTVDAGNVSQIAIGDSFGASIAPTRTEIDVYQFDALAGDQLVIPVSRLTGGGFGLTMRLLDSTGSVLDSTTAGATTWQPVAIPAGGRYFLWISEDGLDATGTYHLTLQRTRMPGNVAQVVPGTGAIRASISPTRTEIDVYEFTAPQQLYLKVPYVRATGSGFTLELRLYDAAGNLLLTDGGTSGRLCTAIPSTGQYFLWVRNPALNATGAYDIDVTLDVHNCSR